MLFANGLCGQMLPLEILLWTANMNYQDNNVSPTKKKKIEKKKTINHKRYLRQNNFSSDIDESY